MTDKLLGIYLAGYISGNVIDQCTEWRKKLRTTYDNWNGKRYPINWIDPCNGETLSAISPDGTKGIMPANAIVHKDYKCVADSDVVIANLNTFGQPRAPLGTISEIAWAWQMHKIIVIITDNEGYIHHPFLSYFASWIVPDVETLIKEKIINLIYKSLNNAEY